MRPAPRILTLAEAKEADVLDLLRSIAIRGDSRFARGRIRYTYESDWFKPRATNALGRSGNEKIWQIVELVGPINGLGAKGFREVDEGLRSAGLCTGLKLTRELKVVIGADMTDEDPPEPLEPVRVLPLENAVQIKRRIEFHRGEIVKLTQRLKNLRRERHTVRG